MAASYIWITSYILLFFHQLYCILLYTDLPLTIPFLGLPSNIYLIFLIRLVVTVKMTSVNKDQIRLTPGFVFTKYKVQEAIFKSAVLNLQHKSKKREKESSKRFCFIYIQLSWL